MGYFQSLKNPVNEKFVQAFKAKYGQDRVIGDPMQVAYNSVHLWKLAVEKAKSFDPDAVIAASAGLTLEAPEGTVRVHEKNHHVWKKVRVGRARPDGQFDVVWESPELIEPNPSRNCRPLEAPRAPRTPWHAAAAGAATAGGAYAGPAWKQTMNLDIAAMQLFNGVSLFSILLLMAIGLAVVFGLMGVINMAHGELMAMGAYITYLVSLGFHRWAPGWMDVYLFAAIPLAFAATFAFGYMLERGFIRWFYNRPLDTLLATWGLSLILQQAYRSLFGAQEVSVPLASWLSGAWEPTPDLQFPLNRIFILGLTLLVSIAVYLLLYRSAWGLRVRAVTQNRAMAGAVGINTRAWTR